MECSQQKRHEVIAITAHLVIDYFDDLTNSPQNTSKIRKMIIFLAFFTTFFLNSYKTHHKTLSVKIYYAILYSKPCCAIHQLTTNPNLYLFRF